MPRLFSYGSLRQPAAQQAAFGRLLAGAPDELAGFELRIMRDGDVQLANVVRSVRADSRVGGVVYELSDAELQRADAYELADNYTRLQVTLVSGRDAWVYVDAASAR